MPMKELFTKADVDEVLKLPRAAILKHSSRCSLSARANSVVQQFMEENLKTPIFLIRVIESRDASLYLAEKVGVTHASPQLLVLRNGTTVWHASHHEITPSLINKLES